MMTRESIVKNLSLDLGMYEGLITGLHKRAAEAEAENVELNGRFGGVQGRLCASELKNISLETIASERFDELCQWRDKFHEAELERDEYDAEADELLERVHQQEDRNAELSRNNGWTLLVAVIGWLAAILFSLGWLNK